MARPKKLKFKVKSEHHFNTVAHHLNINSRPLCERLTGVFPDNYGSRTDNPTRVLCPTCLMGWDAVLSAGLKTNWAIAAYDGSDWHVINSVHHATLSHHLDKVLAQMGISR